MITLSNIKKTYKNNSIFDNLSLQIEDGSFIAVTGESGSGKTTLLNIMGLLESPDKGMVSIDGQNHFTTKSKLLFYRYKAGFLFQNFALIEDRTVLENLMIALAYRKAVSKRNTISMALDSVGLSGSENKKIFQLSGGEQQRVALARIILKDPQYIFADEPTGNLDLKNRDIVFQHLINFNDKGKTVIFVSHDKELVSKVTNVIQLK